MAVDTNHTHNTAGDHLECHPLFLCIILFRLGLQALPDFAIPPKDAIEIRVTGQKWCGTSSTTTAL